MKTKLSIFCILLLIFTCTAFAEEKEQTESETEKTSQETSLENRRWIGADFSHGTAMHIWSDRTYKGYENWSFGMFMEWESPRKSIFSLDIAPVWRGEVRYFRLLGTIPLSSDQLTDEELKWYEDRGIDEYDTELDHHQITFLIVRRWFFLPDEKIRPFLELGFGMSFTNELIITNGTIWAFDFIGGGGFEFDISPKWTGYAAARAAHFSNGGEMYLTNKDTIGPESISWVLGIRYEL